MTKSNSYNNDWGIDCFRMDAEEAEPCWGTVMMIDDGIRADESGNYYEVNAIYACEGHYGWPYQPYLPEEEKR